MVVQTDCGFSKLQTVLVGRPVAAISIGPNGVVVEPIVDATKIALAFFTMLGSMLLMFSRMQKASK